MSVHLTTGCPRLNAKLYFQSGTPAAPLLLKSDGAYYLRRLSLADNFIQEMSKTINEAGLPLFNHEVRKPEVSGSRWPSLPTNHWLYGLSHPITRLVLSKRWKWWYRRRLFPIPVLRFKFDIFRSHKTLHRRHFLLCGQCWHSSEVLFLQISCVCHDDFLTHKLATLAQDGLN